MNPYGVLHYATLTDLIIEANRYIAKGYAPSGGICHDGEYYVQAMYRKPPAKVREANDPKYTQAFEDIWNEYPKRAGSNSKAKAFSAYSARIKGGAPAEHSIMSQGVDRYADYCKATGKLGTEFVMQASTFFGPDQHYLNNWAKPDPVKEGATMLPAKNEELLAWALEQGYQPPAAGQSWSEYRATLAEASR